MPEIRVPIFAFGRRPVERFAIYSLLLWEKEMMRVFPP
jgi:hypothetical protein